MSSLAGQKELVLASLNGNVQGARKQVLMFCLKFRHTLENHDSAVLKSRPLTETTAIHEIINVEHCKWRHERSSRLIRNLSNCEREAWKKFRLQRDSNPWPLQYRCSALPTELWSHNCWEQVNFSGSIMPLRVIQHYSDWVCTAVMSKWRHERSSRLIRNLSNCEREAWKKFRLQRDSNPWPLRYRCSALPIELWSHNCWEQVNFSGSIMPLRVIQHYSDWVCTAVMSKCTLSYIQSNAYIQSNWALRTIIFQDPCHKASSTC